MLLIGDGAAQLTVQELGAFSREGLSPVIVVVNNDGYTIERMIHGKTAPYNDIVRWSWADIPTALGVTNTLTSALTPTANSTTRLSRRRNTATGWC